MINGFWEPMHFRIQEGDSSHWRRFIDTSRPSPKDIVDAGLEEALESLDYILAPRSIAVLVRAPQ
jgi:glycogen operon protein